MTVARADCAREEVNILKVYLGISGKPEEDHQRVEGSYQWIEETKEFMK